MYITFAKNVRSKYKSLSDIIFEGKFFDQLFHVDLLKSKMLHKGIVLSHTILSNFKK